MPAAKRIGFLGLGIMGSRMAANLQRAGFEVTVWNRTRQTADDWAAEHGGQVGQSPAAVAAVADIVFTMVVDGPQVRELLLGNDGVGEGAEPGLLCIDCSTIGQAEAAGIGAELAARGLRLLDAPVTGSMPAARDGTLLIMVGGDGADVAQARPALETIGKTVLHVGPLGVWPGDQGHQQLGRGRQSRDGRRGADRRQRRRRRPRFAGRGDGGWLSRIADADAQAGANAEP